jgi:LuxR family maltose regulon positive regulatory protein
MLGERPRASTASAFLEWAGRQITDDPRFDRGKRLFALAAKSMAERLSGDWDSAHQSARSGMRLVDEAELDDDDTRVLLPVVASQFGLSLLGHGDVDDAAAAFELTWDPSAGPLDAPLATDAVALLAATNVLRGEVNASEGLLTHAPSRPRWTGFRDLITAPLFHLARAEVHIEHFRLDDAQTEIARVAHRLDRTEHWPWLLAAQARIDLGTGHPAASLATLDARLNGEGPPPSPYARTELDMHRAVLLLARGRARDAEQVLDSCPGADPRVVIGRALTQLTTGRTVDAHAMTSRALRRPTPPRLRASLLMIAVAALLRLERPAAVPLLDELSVLLTEHGVRFPFALLQRDDLAALRGALAARSLPRARHAVEALAEIPSLIPPILPQEELSPRELIVLAELVRAESVTQIAQRLFVSPNTVKAQVRSIYRKLGVASREEALIAASERQLL